MKDYYVYAYMHPKKEFHYDDGLVCLDHVPYYIGKGCGNRITQSHKDVLSEKSNNKQMIEETKDIRLFHNSEPIIEILCDNLNEKQAFLLEAYLIDSLGLDNLSNRINGVHAHLLEEEIDIVDMLEMLEEI